jgi:hypothetical protein
VACATEESVEARASGEKCAQLALIKRAYRGDRRPASGRTKESVARGSKRSQTVGRQRGRQERSAVQNEIWSSQNQKLCGRRSGGYDAVYITHQNHQITTTIFTNFSGKGSGYRLEEHIVKTAVIHPSACAVLFYGAPMSRRLLASMLDAPVAMAVQETLDGKPGKKHPAASLTGLMGKRDTAQAMSRAIAKFSLMVGASKSLRSAAPFAFSATTYSLR